MIKRILCALMAVLMILSFASCGSRGSDAPSDKPDDKAVSFETTDLKGNKYSSSEIFSKYDITLVNLWGTYCGPCIREMPGLQELDVRLKEKNCAVVGIVIDVSSHLDTAMVRAADAVIKDTGAEYLNLVYWDGLLEVFPAEFIPTTYLVDSQGRIVGTPSVGAMGADEYEKLVDEALKAIGK